jgi:hypothetical protein
MATSKEPNTALRRLLLVAIAIWCLGALPLFAKIFGFQFLPSIHWWEESTWFAWGAGIFAGAIGTLGIFRSFSRNEPDGMSLKSFMLLLFAPFFFGSPGMHAVSVGFPMIYTSLLGEQGDHLYVVERAEGFSDRKCRKKIELQGNPFMYDELCGFSDEFRNTLRPGIDVIVYGRSSYFGVFVAGARTAD